MWDHLGLIINLAEALFFLFSQVLVEKMGVPDLEALERLRKEDLIDHSLDYLVVKLGTQFSHDILESPTLKRILYINDLYIFLLKCFIFYRLL